MNLSSRAMLVTLLISQWTAKELCGILPKLNIGNDQKLETLSNRVQAEIASLNPDVLRNNKSLRKQTAETADEIFNLMSSYMGGN